jgi:hypothetical protein
VPFVFLPSFLVQEDPAISIPMGLDANQEADFLSSNCLVCRFNGFWPRLVALCDWTRSLGFQ